MYGKYFSLAWNIAVYRKTKVSNSTTLQYRQFLRGSIKNVISITHPREQELNPGEKSVILLVPKDRLGFFVSSLA